MWSKLLMPRHYNWDLACDASALVRIHRLLNIYGLYKLAAHSLYFIIYSYISSIYSGEIQIFLTRRRLLLLFQSNRVADVMLIFWCIPIVQMLTWRACIGKTAFRLLFADALLFDQNHHFGHLRHTRLQQPIAKTNGIISIQIHYKHHQIGSFSISFSNLFFRHCV